MTGRRLLAAVLAALWLGILLAASGCTAGPDSLKRTKDGGWQYTEGSDVWAWSKTGGKAQLMLNGKTYAVIGGGQALISLTDGRAIDVTLDRNSNPVSIKTAWGTQLNQSDYTSMNTAFKVNQMAGGVQVGGPWGWIIVTLLIILLGLLAQFKAGTIVDWAKGVGIFSSFDTAKSLLIVRAVSVLVVIVGFIGLLVAIF